MRQNDLSEESAVLAGKMFHVRWDSQSPVRNIDRVIFNIRDLTGPAVENKIKFALCLSYPCDNILSGLLIKTRDKSLPDSTFHLNEINTYLLIP